METLNHQGQINVNVEDGVKELVIRHGQAPEPVDIKPRALNIIGNIKAPANFWLERKQLYNKDLCHVEYSLSKQYLRLVLNETSPYQGVVMGHLQLNPDIASLRINDFEKGTNHFLFQIDNHWCLCTGFGKNR